MDKTEVSQILAEMAILLELTEANPFKIRAFENGARIIEGVAEDLNDLVSSKKLTDIKGIGEGLASIITALVRQGKSKEYEDLKKSVPRGLLDMLSIQGVGPKKVKLLYQKLNIKSISDLKKACEKGALKKLAGFGEKTQSNILQGIQHHQKNIGKYMFNIALHEAQKLKNHLKEALSKKIKQIEIAGSLRRRNECVRDIDILISSDSPADIMNQFIAYPHVQRVLAKGKTKSSVILDSGINADLRVVTETEFPFALHYFTGSKTHNTEMRSLAKSNHLKLNEYGLFKGEKRIPCKDEESIFQALGLAYIEPELRENSGELEAAKKGNLPKRLIELKDLKGVFHTHTTFSDGVASLEAMVKKAQAMGLEYIGISDHSQSAYYANGMKPDRLKKQFKDIDTMNNRLKSFRILKGGEVDILADGTLDYPDSLLAEFDFVIASVHSKFKMTEKEMTERIIKALKHKYVTMIGHPTGRLLLSREAYPVNLFEIVKVASDYGKAMELNANPHRFDIDWKICKFAKSKRVPVSINPDAHHTDGIEDIAYGIGIARKGWLTKEDVLNTRPLKDIVSFLKSYRDPS